MNFTKIAFWSYYENFAKKNLIFNQPCDWNNKLFYKYQLLYKILLDNNFLILPLDTVDLKEVKVVIFYDIPKNIKKLLKKINQYKNIKKILIIEECKELRPSNWKLEIHKNFDTIFTWSNYHVLKNKKYKKIYLTNLNKNSEYFKKITYNKNKIIFLNSNKKLCSNNELYSLRTKLIKYAMDNKINNFKLFGNDWNRKTFSMNKWYSFLNSKKFDKIFHSNKYKKVSNGRVKDKDKKMSQFDFAICFENVYGIPDYVTEKITDAMTAGVIPIYYGCPNIYDYFPSNTFIDFRNFDSIENLFDCLLTMPVKKIFAYKKNIRSFLLSKKSYIYTGDHFAKEIKDEILLAKE